MKDDHHSHKPIIPWYFWAIAAGTVILWGTTVPLVKWMGFGSPDGAGTFGDTFGALNALFSGLAFLGVMASIFIQGREFRSQLEEMRTTATEMEKQSKIYDAQLESLKKQNHLLGKQFLEGQFIEQMAAQPIWNVVAKLDHNNFISIVTNAGGIAYNVECVSSLSSETKTKTSWPGDERPMFFRRKLGDSSNCKFSIKYTTKLGYTRKEEFVFNVNSASQGTGNNQDELGVAVTSVREMAAIIRDEIESV